MIKFHPSQLDKLMTDGRSKNGKYPQTPDDLSETTKSALNEIFIEEKYGRKLDIRTDAMNKGIMVEADAFKLLYQTNHGLYSKNTKQFENEFFIGTPDAIASDCGVDLKNSYDIWNFMAVSEAKVLKTYQYQMLAYMDLVGFKLWKIFYTLFLRLGHQDHEQSVWQDY